jgi:hypothetical protein
VGGGTGRYLQGVIAKDATPSQGNSLLYKTLRLSSFVHTDAVTNPDDGNGLFAVTMGAGMQADYARHNAILGSWGTIQDGKLPTPVLPCSALYRQNQERGLVLH